MRSFILSQCKAKLCTLAFTKYYGLMQCGRGVTERERVNYSIFMSGFKLTFSEEFYELCSLYIGAPAVDDVYAVGYLAHTVAMLALTCRLSWLKQETDFCIEQDW